MEGIIFISLIFSVLTGIYASKKNRNGLGYFVLSLIISPVITFIIIYAAGEKK